ncbi:MAG: metallophosphoesterase [Gammaproteobacteria bacterium]|nr:metallophosphoesterase [Gammaproteobacteria bacterium]
MKLSAPNYLLFGVILMLPLGCQPSDEPPVAAHRIVVMGDLHADIGVTRKAFQLAGATDKNDDWTGGSLVIVQLGDFIGRSDDDRQVLDFLLDIRQKARAGGGTVHVLIGNHEIFGARVDNQAVGRNPFSDFEDVAGLNLEDPRLGRLPEYQRARGAALMSGGPYAKLLADFPAVLKIGKTVFVHGGVVPRWAEYGIDKINAEVSQWLLGNTREPNSVRGVDNGDRVMWTRQFSYNVDPYDCSVLDESLRILGAERMIVAHTVHPEITVNCDSKLWGIDVGMSRAYGGKMQLLEIIDDEVLSVIRL